MDFDIGAIKELFNGFDPAALLPDIGSLVGVVTLICRLAILLAPLVLAGLGLCWLIFPAKEANYHYGYRTFFGMGSVSAWRSTQKLAGICFAALGAVLTLVMLMTSITFSSMDPMDMVWSTMRCLLWEAAAAVITILAINAITTLRFNFRGEKRAHK